MGVHTRKQTGWLRAFSTGNSRLGSVVSGAAGGLAHGRISKSCCLLTTSQLTLLVSCNHESKLVVTWSRAGATTTVAKKRGQRAIFFIHLERQKRDDIVPLLVNKEAACTQHA